MYSHGILEPVKPTIEYGPAYLAMVDELIQAGEEYNYNNIELACEDLAQFVHELEDETKAKGKQKVIKMTVAGIEPATLCFGGIHSIH